MRGNLTRAFAELNELGVLARENFKLLWHLRERRDPRRAGRLWHWRGFLWYHQQDTESLLASEDGEVYLGYGVYPPADFDEVAYAGLSEAEAQASYQGDLERLLDEVAFPVLRKHGMRVEWNRRQSRRIRSPAPGGTTG